MRIAIFVEKYPAPYKTYFDAQFGEFVRAGHDVSIYSAGSSAAGVNERVLEYGLQDLTLHYPESAGSLPRDLRGIISGLSTSTFGARQAARVTAGITPGRRRMADTARVLSIRGAAPDICILHGLSAAAQFSWLRRAFPHVPVVLYYHGGELPTTPPISDAAATAAFLSADRVFTNTAFSRAHAIERGCPPERIHVLPVGFALDDYVPPAPRV
ncbi:MAG TPA: glycosyltransferase [Longimicrobiales bacterium]|nr:glycosyltransferase [Longimicrobiales bacterium]